jgi:hypothetical protein
MCKAGYTHFPCGPRCSRPDPSTLTQCEWAKLKGHVCPDFQVDEDKTKSTTVEQPCSVECAVRQLPAVGVYWARMYRDRSAASK